MQVKKPFEMLHNSMVWTFLSESSFLLYKAGYVSFLSCEIWRLTHKGNAQALSLFLCFPQNAEQSPKNPVFVNEHVYRYNHEKDCKEQDQRVSVFINTYTSKDNDSLTRSVYDNFSNIMCHMVSHKTWFILRKCANAQKMGMEYFLVHRSSLEYQMLCFVVEILTYTSIGLWKAVPLRCNVKGVTLT